MKISIKALPVCAVTVNPSDYRTLAVDIEDFDAAEFIGRCAQSAIEDLLDAIGQERAVVHFELELAEESE